MWSEWEWLGGQGYYHLAHEFHSTELLPSVNQGKSNHLPSSLSQDNRGQEVPGQNIFWCSEKFFSELFMCMCACGSGFNKILYNSQTIKMFKNPQVCGLPPRVFHVINNWDVRITQLMWETAVVQQGRPWCGIRMLGITELPNYHGSPKGPLNPVVLMFFQKGPFPGCWTGPHILVPCSLNSKCIYSIHWFE